MAATKTGIMVPQVRVKYKGSTEGDRPCPLPAKAGRVLASAPAADPDESDARDMTSAESTASDMPGRERPPVMWAVATITAAQVIGLLVALGIGAAATLRGASESTMGAGSAIGIDVLMLIAVAFGVWLVIGTMRIATWIRGPLIVWNVLAFGVGAAFTQGAEPQWPLAIALVVPAVAAVALVLSRPFQAEVQRSRQLVAEHDAEVERRSAERRAAERRGTTEDGQR